jgi:ribose transport system substrate-binding protein
MKNKHRILLAVSICTVLLSVLAISSYYYFNGSYHEGAQVKISAIVYGADIDRWSTLKQGLDQGAVDFNVEVNLVTAKEDESAEEQVELIERELANGAGGIILAAADSLQLSDKVREYAKTVPIVLVETGIRNLEGMTYIAADDYSMGLNLGRSVFLGSDKNKSIAVFVNNLERDSVLKRYDGFQDSLQYSEKEIFEWEMTEQDTETAQFLETQLTKHPVDIVVALDDQSMEAAIDAVLAMDSPVSLYGIGSTNKIVHYLDYGLIDSIVFENEFNMGYLSVQELVHDIRNETVRVDHDIEFRTVNKETMYLPRNQRLVFPIVQ